MRKYELKPVSQKSFYGRAYVYVADDGTETLYSYGTPVARRKANGAYERLWGGYSATTAKHVKAFGWNICKAEWLKQEVVR